MGLLELHWWHIFAKRVSYLSISRGDGDGGLGGDGGGGGEGGSQMLISLIEPGKVPQQPELPTLSFE